MGWRRIHLAARWKGMLSCHRLGSCRTGTAGPSLGLSGVESLGTSHQAQGSQQTLHQHRPGAQPAGEFFEQGCFSTLQAGLEKRLFRRFRCFLSSQFLQLLGVFGGVFLKIFETAFAAKFDFLAFMHEQVGLHFRICLKFFIGNQAGLQRIRLGLHGLGVLVLGLGFDSMTADG